MTTYYFIKKAGLGILLLFLYSAAAAQTLSGTVYDARGKKPVADVFVYLDGTSFFTTTKADGKFELKTDKAINTSLVLSHVSFQTMTISHPFRQLPEKIYLEEKDHTLQEVVIVADQFTRAEKLKAFKEQFLGATKPGKSCRIINEDDIQVHYDKHSQTLTATSVKPIIIVNDFLAYQIQFTLIDFKTQFSGDKISPDYSKQSFFAGTSLFMDLDPNSRRIRKRRDEVYEYSATCFFKHLANNTIETSKHMVFNKQSTIHPYQYFSVTDTLSQKRVQIKPNTNLEKSVIGIKQPLFGVISVMYKRIQSAIYFLTDDFLVDQYGNLNTIDHVLFGGHMGNLRAGDMLPLDYEPTHTE